MDFFLDKTFTLLDINNDGNKYFEFPAEDKWYNYSYILKDDFIIIYNKRKNELYNIRKNEFLN